MQPVAGGTLDQISSMRPLVVGSAFSGWSIGRSAARMLIDIWSVTSSAKLS